jgi:hypothetical protein
MMEPVGSQVTEQARGVYSAGCINCTASQGVPCHTAKMKKEEILDNYDTQSFQCPQFKISAFLIGRPVIKRFWTPQNANSDILFRSVRTPAAARLKRSSMTISHKSFIINMSKTEQTTSHK